MRLDENYIKFAQWPERVSSFILKIEHFNKCLLLPVAINYWKLYSYLSEISFGSQSSYLTLVFVMTHPFQYDAYVRSEVRINGLDSPPETYAPPRPRYHPLEHQASFKAVHQPTGRAKLQSQINHIIGLCQTENDAVNNEFTGVVKAERDIYNLMKSQMPKQSETSVSNDKYFHPNFQNTLATPASNRHPSNFNQHDFSLGNQQQRAYNPAIQNNSRYQEYDDDALVKQKIRELMQQNRQLRNEVRLADSADENQTKLLQKQIVRLKSLIPQYEAKILTLKSNKGYNSKLRQLKELGEEIRQNTLALLLRQKSSTSFQNNLPPSSKEYAQQLNSLRRACQQLEAENNQLKRLSKGTDYTRIPQKY